MMGKLTFSLWFSPLVKMHLGGMETGGGQTQLQRTRGRSFCCGTDALSCWHAFSLIFDSVTVYGKYCIVMHSHAVYFINTINVYIPFGTNQCDDYIPDSALWSLYPWRVTLRWEMFTLNQRLSDVQAKPRNWMEFTLFKIRGTLYWT